MSSKKQQRNVGLVIASASGLVLAAGLGLFALYRYKISSPSQYLVKTGLGIKDMRISKTTMVWPFQQWRFIGVPVSDSAADHSHHSEKVEQVIQGIIEGETRVLAAGMSIEDIFRSRSQFKTQIVEKVQEELDKFGLTIYNSNIKELQDVEGSEYFRYLRQKTVEGANNQGIIDVSEAKMKGVVGERERTGLTRQQVARIESETILAENERQKQIIDSQVQLEVKRAQADQIRQIAQVEAKQATALRLAELEAGVNQAKAKEQTEKLRSEILSDAHVRAESAIKEAEGHMEASKRQADGLLYAKQKEADGTLALLTAQAEGIQRISNSLGGKPDHLLQYLMLDKRVYQDLAQANAQAVHGLNPHITVWHTDGSSSNPTSPLQTITDLYKSLPPVLSSVEQLTGMKPPSWLVSKTPDLPPREERKNAVPNA